MSIVTYILLTAFHAGIHSRFNPAVRLSFLLLPFKYSNFFFSPFHLPNDIKWAQTLGVKPQINISRTRSSETQLLGRQSSSCSTSYSSSWDVILNISGSSQVVDLVAYGGYKSVGLISFSASFRARDEMVMLTFRYRVIFALIAGFVLSGPLWTLIFVYTFLANAFFLVSCFFSFSSWNQSTNRHTNIQQLRSLRTIILPDSSNIPASHATSTVTHAQRRRRIAFLLMEVGVQVLYMGWLVGV